MKKIKYLLPLLLLVLSSCNRTPTSSSELIISSEEVISTTSENDVTSSTTSFATSEESGSSSLSSVLSSEKESFSSDSSSEKESSSTETSIIQTGYYSGIDINSTGATLMNALHKKIKSFTSVSYDALKEHYKTTDNNNGYFWDMYSNKKYPITQAVCSNYSKEGDGWNREHSIPQSWFNKSSPMKSDIFHVYPTDAKVNGVRSNYPFGEVKNATYTSSNGCKLGSNAGSGPSTVFEPCDEYKGDFARTYFYFATCYMNKTINSGEGSSVFTGSMSYPKLTTYSINLFLKWHEQDPVSEKEINRNEACYGIQKNRNPFIDHPSFAQQIWG